MTLICKIVVNGVPMLFGDLMISTDSGETVELPTIGSVAPRPRDAFPQPAGMLQKVVHIGPRCVLAWAGPCVAARHVVRELRDLADVGELTFEKLTEYFRGLDRSVSVFRELSVLGMHFDGVEHRGFSLNAFRVDIDGFDEVMLAGSGVNHLEVGADGSTTPLAVVALQRAMAAMRDDPNARGALAAALMLQAQLLLVELSGGTTVDHLYGGGFEIAYLDNGSFRKIDEVVHLFSRCELESPHDPGEVFIGTPFRTSRAIYDGSTLLVVNADFLSEADGSSTTTVGVHAITDVCDDTSTPNVPADVLALFDRPRVVCLNLLVVYRERIVALMPVVSVASSAGEHELVAVVREGNSLGWGLAPQSAERFGRVLFDLRSMIDAEQSDDAPT